MATVTDSFTDTEGTVLTSHTGDSGTGWVDDPSAPDSRPLIHNNALHGEYRSNPTTSIIAGALLDLSDFTSTDLIVEVTLAAATNLNPSYRATILTGGSRVISMGRPVADYQQHAIVLGSYFAISAGNWVPVTWRFEFVGDTVTVYANDVQVGAPVTNAAVTPSLAQMEVGIELNGGTYGINGRNYTLDDFSVTVSADAGGAPGTPSGLAATSGDGQVTLSWTGGGGATSHNLYWSTTPGVTTASTKITGVTSPHVHSGLTNGQPYYYAVEAENALGVSALSAEASATPAQWEPTPTELDLAEYRIMGTWKAERWGGGPSPTLRLVELKKRSEVDLPPDVWSYDDFPNLAEGAVGHSIPIAYGTLFGVTCTCVDTSTNTFRVCGHALTALRAVYQDGTPVTATSVDLNTSEFVVSGWDGSAEITADVIGKPDSNGFAMVNPADVVEDLLVTYAGETAADLDASAFATARNAWVLGTDGRTGAEVHRPALALWIENTTNVRDVLERIDASAFALTYISAGGQWWLGAWSPAIGDGLTEFRAHDIVDAAPSADTSDAVTRVVASYNGEGGGEPQLASVESGEWRDRRGLSAHRTLQKELPFSQRRDAEWWAQRILRMWGVPLRLWDVEVGPRALLVVPGQFVRLTKPARGLSGIFEVLEVRGNLTRGTVRLVVGDVRGFGNQPGFWAADSPVLPASVGAGAASPWDSGWSSDEKTAARENFGYWADDDEFADPTDEDAYRTGVWV